MLKEPMPLINLTFVHGQTLEEARRRLEKAVHEGTSQFGGVRRVEWAADRNRVKLEGAGVWVEMWVDAQNVHATGDIPILGELLGGPLTSRLKQVLQQAFQKKLR
jgi:Putative polyhydroxyalkanoic acid system protein (PHA_gran_rgn)